MRHAGAFKGATAYEAWLWRFYVRLPYWRFLRVGCWPSLGFDTTPANIHDDEE